MHDVPAQLEKMGVEVTDALAKAEEASDADVLRRFEMLPKLFRGRQVTIEFEVNNVRAAFPEDCAALHLEHGATVACQAAVGSGQTFYIYAFRDKALELLRIPKGSMVTARANTAFGTWAAMITTAGGYLWITALIDHLLSWISGQRVRPYDRLSSFVQRGSTRAGV
jgi:hypothetical protein